MRLNPRPRPDTRRLLNFGKRADKAVIPDLSSVEIARFGYFDARTEGNILHTDMLDV